MRKRTPKSESGKRQGEKTKAIQLGCTQFDCIQLYWFKYLWDVGMARGYFVAHKHIYIGYIKAQYIEHGNIYNEHKEISNKVYIIYNGRKIISVLEMGAKYAKIRKMNTSDTRKITVYRDFLISPYVYNSLYYKRILFYAGIFVGF